MQQETLCKWRLAAFITLHVLNVLLGIITIFFLFNLYGHISGAISLNADYVPLTGAIFITIGIVALFGALGYSLSEIGKLATSQSLLTTTALFAATCSLLVATITTFLHAGWKLDILNYLVVSGNISFPIMLDAIIVPVLSFALLGIIIFVKIQWNKYVYWILIASLLVLAILAIIGAVPCFICTFMRMN